MAEIERQKTPASKEAALAAIDASFQKEFGRRASSEELGLILAHTWGLETNRGQSVYNHNPGFMSGTFNGDFFRPHWFTITDESSDRMKELNKQMKEGKAPSKFRAYSSLGEGYGDHMTRLRKNFPALLEAAKTGDPNAYAQAIASSNYTPGINTAAAANTLASFQKEFGTLEGGLGELPIEGTPPTPLTPKRFPMGLVLLGGIGAVAYYSRKAKR